MGVLMREGAVPDRENALTRQGYHRHWQRDPVRPVAPRRAVAGFDMESGFP